jgi:hypothetical protein
MRRFPWEVASELTEVRLRLIAAVFDRVRKEVAELHEPEKGDGNWGFGCRAYERTCFALSRMAKEDEYKEWLSVDVGGLVCTLRVAGIPIKFYRGDPADPSPRALRGAVNAALHDVRSGQASMFSMFERGDMPETTLFWLLAIDTHPDLTVSRVVIFQANEYGSARNEWEIPLDETVSAVASVNAFRPEGVDLAPPVVQSKTDEIATRGGAPKQDEQPAASTAIGGGARDEST